jgi:hypothetical protein
MSRIQRLGIGNGGVDCQISYMQGKKYPNAGEIVKPVQGVSNRNLLKNPYNTINEPIAKPGERPLRITTDNRGNVFARSETMLVPGVTNNNLLKNPYNILEEPVPEKRTLSLQRIKDINSGNLPKYVTENRGINEIMLQILIMIYDKPIKLITIQLLKILITKNASSLPEQTQQRILAALNAFDVVLTEGRKVFRENTLSPTKIPEMLQPAVTVYENEIRRIYGAALPKANYAGIDADIQTGLSEIALLSNALTRMFEYNNAVDPSNTLTREQIMSASLSGGVPPVGGVVPPAEAAGGVGAPPDPLKANLAQFQKTNEAEIQRITDYINSFNTNKLFALSEATYPLSYPAIDNEPNMKSVCYFLAFLFTEGGDIPTLRDKVKALAAQPLPKGATEPSGWVKSEEVKVDDDWKARLIDFCTDRLQNTQIRNQIKLPALDAVNSTNPKIKNNPFYEQYETLFNNVFSDFFFQQAVNFPKAETGETGETAREKERRETAERMTKQAASTQALGAKPQTQAEPVLGFGRRRAPKNKKVIIQTGARTIHPKY